jgi:hypothetical protein
MEEDLELVDNREDYSPSPCFMFKSHQELVGIWQSPKVIKEALAYADVTGNQDKST